MQILCPECQRQLRVPEEAVGRPVQCPACQATFPAGGPTDREQIQAPLAPRPTPAPAMDDSIDVSGSRRQRWDADDDDLVLRGGGEEVQGRAANSSLWLFITAGVTLLVAVINIIMTFTIGLFDDGPFGPFADPEEFAAGLACGGCCGVLLIVANILITIGASQLRSFGTKGWVICAIVISFGQALLFGGGAFINVIFLAVEPQEALAHWTPLTLLLSGGVAVLNCFAGVKTILTLNHASVDAEFERHSGKRRRRRIRWDD